VKFVASFHETASGPNESYVAALSKNQLRILRNSIYAQKGLIFKDKELTDFFKQFTWYKPSLNKVELSNVDETNLQLISKLENLETLKFDDFLNLFRTENLPLVFMGTEDDVPTSKLGGIIPIWYTKKYLNKSTPSPVYPIYKVNLPNKFVLVALLDSSLIDDYRIIIFNKDGRLISKLNGIGTDYDYHQYDESGLEEDIKIKFVFKNEEDITITEVRKIIDKIKKEINIVTTIDSYLLESSGDFKKIGSKRSNHEMKADEK